MAILVNENILRLYVSMDDAISVDLFNRQNELS